MGTLSVPAALFFLCAATCVHAEVMLGIGDSTKFTFATVGEGRAILESRDDFVQRMSPFDRASRMKTDRDVSEVEFLDFVGGNVLSWTQTEKQKIAAVIQSLQADLEALALPFPGEVHIIKTTGNEEGGAAYTRANAIVLPQAQLQEPVQKLQKIICHELFHILSRANPDLSNKLYSAIGFVKCGEVAFPRALESRKITNPDAPRNDHCIRLRVGDEDVWAVPILFSSDEKYDVGRGGRFFDYLQFRFLLVEWGTESASVTPIYSGDDPVLVGIQKVSGFFEQVGRNTDYIIHPEEILADNFAFLVLGEHDLPSPEIVAGIETILNEARTPEPGAPANGSQPIR